MAFFSPLRPSYIHNPYPALARLREAEPVHFSRELRAWIVTRYDDALRVLHDTASFSPNPDRGQPPLSDSYRALHQQSPLAGIARLNRTDPPEHRRLREVVTGYFTREFLGGVEHRLRAVVAGTVDALASGEMDVMAQFADPLPRAAVMAFLGVPEEERGHFHRWVWSIRHVEVVPDVGHVARQDAIASLEALARYLDERARTLPAEPGEVLDRVWASKVLSEPERLGLVVDLALSGNGAMSATLGNAVHTLLGWSGGRRWLERDSDAARSAFEETLRYEAPVSALGRWALHDAEVGDETVRGGDHVILMVASANRDPAVFARPDEFDPSRRGRRPLSFGAGHHLCVGAPLARMVGQQALVALAGRFPEMRLSDRDASSRAPFVRSWMTRHLASLPVVASDG